MKTRKYTAPLLIATAFLITACEPKDDGKISDSRDSNTSPADKIVKLAGGLFAPLDACKLPTPPKQTYRLKIDKNFNFYSTTDRFVVTGVDDATNGEIKNNPAKRPSVENTAGATPLDFAVFLKEDETARVEIEVDNEVVRFMNPYNGSEMAVTAASGLGLEYLCGLEFLDERKIVRFTVQRPKGAGTAGYMGYNIGLIIKQGAYDLPLHIDPNIKNDG